MFVRVYPKADTPLISVANAISDEDPPQPIPLNITARPTDLDGSESLNVTICNCFENDADGDQVGDRCDICPFVPNAGIGPNLADRYNQQDTNGDGIGDACCEDHLRAHWKFNEEAGSFAYDETQFRNTLFVRGADWIPASAPNGVDYALNLFNTRIEVFRANEYNSLGVTQALSMTFSVHI